MNTEPLTIGVGTVLAVLFAGNIFWIKRLIGKIDHIDSLRIDFGKLRRSVRHQGAEIKALKELTFTSNSTLKYIQGKLGIPEQEGA